MRFTALALIGAALPAVSAAASFVSPTAASTAAPVQMTPEARAYLDRAIALFRQQHINASKMDWSALTAKAYAAAAGAKTTADTYPAIWLIIKELGEKHTFFLDPDHAKAESSGQASGKASAPPLLLPEAVELSNGIGIVRLYGFTGSPEQAKLYADTGQAEIKRLEARAVCRFVVDLRFNSGGNMYPMIDAVSGLLHDGVLGTFENATGYFTPWVLKNGKTATAATSDAGPHPTEGPPNTSPVAVLVGPSTVSAGEYTAMSFRGRANTRFFGAPTGGYITANSPAPLPDGAVIIMTGAWGIDRTGKKYVDAMQPDEETGAGGPAIDAAVKWLARQRCTAVAARSQRSAKRR